MKKLSYNALVSTMREHNRAHNITTQSCKDSEKLEAVIVYSQNNFETEYTEQERSYRTNNLQKLFLDGMISNSLFGSCLDGKDMNVKLSAFDWDVEYCYILNKNHEFIEKSLKDLNLSWQEECHGSLSPDWGLFDGMSTPMHYLIKYAGQCDSFSSDILYSFNEINESMKDKDVSSFEVYMGFRKEGVDSDMYMATRLSHPAMYGSLQDIYHQICKLCVDKEYGNFQLLSLFD